MKLDDIDKAKYLLEDLWRYTDNMNVLNHALNGLQEMNRLYVQNNSEHYVPVRVSKQIQECILTDEITRLSLNIANCIEGLKDTGLVVLGSKSKANYSNKLVHTGAYKVTPNGVTKVNYQKDDCTDRHVSILKLILCLYNNNSLYFESYIWLDKDNEYDMCIYDTILNTIKCVNY